MSEAKWIQVYLGNFGDINENWLSLWRWHFFHPYDLVIISELSKKGKLCHFDILKCNFCLMLQRSHLLFFLDLKTNYDYRFKKEMIFWLLLACPMANFGPLLIANIFFCLVLLNVVFISFTFPLFLLLLSSCNKILASCFKPVFV